MKTWAALILFILTQLSSVSYAGGPKNHENYYNVGHLSFISLQVPIDANGAVSTDLNQQIEQTFQNLVATAQQAGALIEDGKIKNVVKLNVYIKNIKSLSAVDAQMLKYISGNLPARSPIAGIDYGAAGFLVTMDAVVELPL